MKHLIILVLFFCSTALFSQDYTFSEEDEATTFLNLEEESVLFGSILEENKGKTVLIDIWASWCKDCIIGMPEIKKIRKKYPDVIFVYISLDRTIEKWKWAIAKYKLDGKNHYFSPNGWKSDLFTSIDLDWVPRYMLLDKNGDVITFRAIKANDKELINNIRKLEHEK